MRERPAASAGPSDPARTSGRKAFPGSRLAAPVRWTVLLLSLTMALAGCSGDVEPDGADDVGDAADGMEDGEAMTPEPTVFDVSLSGAYPATIAYTPSAITVAPGVEVTIRFTNDDENPLPNHDWVLEGFEETASTALAANGETVEVTFTAPEEPGTYAFYCSVPGHRDNGMEGTFTVVAA